MKRNHMDMMKPLDHRGMLHCATLVLVVLAGVGRSSHAADGDFVWAKRMGGTGGDGSWDIALDSAGNVYTTGYFEGTADFDPGPGTFNLTSAGNSDIFVSKLDAEGNFIWAKRMGGTSNDSGFGIAVDAAGNVYTTGVFQGTADFDPGAGTFNLTSAGELDIFVSKLDADGNFVWAKAMGGTESGIGRGIALDAAGNVYTTGNFMGTVDFDPGTDIFNLTSVGDHDIFVSRLDAEGNFVWAKAIGGTSNDQSWGIAVDAAGNIYTTGWFQDTLDFNLGAGIQNLTSTGGHDIFVSKLDAGGNFLWAKSIGDTEDDRGHGIAVDTLGNVYTTGFFRGTADFDPGPGTFNLTSAGIANIFVLKLDTDGNFVWANAMGGIIDDRGYGIAVDPVGTVYTTGNFGGTSDFDPGSGTFNLSSAGGWDIFLVKLSAPDTTPLDFTNITATPAQAQAGQQVTISFDASGELQANPVVTVNGYTAFFLGLTGNTYTFTYAVSAGDALGAATIEISGEDLAGNPGSAQNTSALLIYAPASGVPLAVWPGIAALGLAGALSLRKRKR